MDGEYNVRIYEQNYTANVVGGIINATIPNLGIDENILVPVTIKDGNYSAFNTTTFNVVPKLISVRISIGNITYGENATVILEADVDGNYTVTIRGVNYIVSVSEGKGNKTIPNLSVGTQIEATVKRDDNYTGFNSTTFDVIKSTTSIDIDFGNIVFYLIITTYKLFYPFSV